MTTINIEHTDWVGYAKFRKFLEKPGENKGTFVTSGIKSNNTINTYLHTHGYKLHPRVTKETTLLIISDEPSYSSSNLDKALKLPNCIIVKEYDMRNLFWAREHIDKASLTIDQSYDV